MASPSDGAAAPVSILNVVVFPAPLTPSKPKHCNADNNHKYCTYKDAEQKEQYQSTPLMTVYILIHPMQKAYLISVNATDDSLHANPSHAKSIPPSTFICHPVKWGAMIRMTKPYTSFAAAKQIGQMPWAGCRKLAAFKNNFSRFTTHLTNFNNKLIIIIISS